MANLNLQYVLDRTDELRARLIKTAILVISLSVIAYIFREHVLNFLQKPLKQENLIFIHPTEAFFTYIKISLFVGVLIGAPFLIFQIVKFFYPSLKGKDGISWIYITSLFLAGTAFFYLGSGFALRGVLPFAIKFLKGISGENLEAVFTVGNYSSFVISGFIFEIPVVTYGLASIGLLTKETLISKWRFIIAGAAVVAAVLTPPDPITQMFLWGPLLILYGLSIVLAAIAGRNRNK